MPYAQFSCLQTWSYERHSQVECGLFTSTHCWNSGRRSPYEALICGMNKLRAARQKRSRRGRLLLCLRIMVMMFIRALTASAGRRSKYSASYSRNFRDYKRSPKLTPQFKQRSQKLQNLYQGRKIFQKFGAAADRTPDFSHAKRTLYH